MALIQLPHESPIPMNQGMVNWPTPSTGPRDPNYPGRCLDWQTARGWFDDGQGGMAVLLVLPLGEGRDLWSMKAPMVFCDHFLNLPYDTVHQRSRFILPIAVSSWCWNNYDGEGGCTPFEARFSDLTIEGHALVMTLTHLYGVLPEIVTHVDT